MHTVEQTLEWLERAVAERGEDFNYCKTYKRGIDAVSAGQTGCRYVEGGTQSEPGCIAGLVFTYAGVSLDDLARREGEAADNIARSFGFTRDAALVLQEAQSVQDSYRTWGEALAAARAYAEELAGQAA